MPPQQARSLEQILAEIQRTFTVEFENLEVDGQTLDVLAITNMQSHLDGLLRRHAIHEPLRDLPLWAKVWPASFVLGRFLRKFEPQGKTLLEIGAGMGVCSLIASRQGFKSILCTDIEENSLNFARANVLRNDLRDLVSVRRLDIKNPPRDLDSPFDFIAASEMLYLEDLHRPLLKFVNRHLAPEGRAFFCSDLARARSHFKKQAATMFKLTDGNVGVKSMDENGNEQRRIYNILILEKK